MATGTLTGQTIANTYKSLLKVTGTTAGGETLHATTLKVIEDGDGNPSPIQLAQNRLEIVPTSDHANAFEVSQADGTQIFNIDSSTPTVKITSASTLIQPPGAMGLVIGSTGAAGASISLDGDSNGDGAGADYCYITHDTDGILNIVQDSPSGTNSIHFGTAGTEDKVVIDSNGRLGIGETEPDSELEIFHATDPQIKFTINTHGDAGIMLGDADGLKLYGKGASNNVRLYSGASTLQMKVDANGITTYDDVVFNEDSADVDFRVESNGNANMLIVDGGNDRVGVGAAPTEATFEVAGTSGEISKFGTLTNGWAANHAFGVANGTGIMISDADADNNTAANRVIGLQRDDTDGHSIFIYDPSGNADIGLRANNTSYIKGGFLGLGHSSPIVNLDVHADTTETAAVFGQADDGSCYIATRTGEVQNNVCGYIFQVGSAALAGYGSANTLATITSVVKNDGGSLKGNLRFTTNQGDSLGGGTTTMELTEEGVVSLTKGQLKFPATQNASADANTLDDYEEGGFEVAVTGQTSGSWTTTSASGYINYIKIGQLCHVSGYVEVDNESSPSGNVKITLPFTACTGLTESSDLQWGFGSISHGGSTVSGMTSMAYIPENSNFCLLAYVQDDGTFSYFTDANVDDTWIARIGFTYRTNG